MVEVVHNFIGEIRLYAGKKAPAGWLFCRGQKISLKDYPALGTVLGNAFHPTVSERNKIPVTHVYLPDLRGRFPLGVYGGGSLGARDDADEVSTRAMGSSGGHEEVSLNIEHLPAHRHDLKMSTVPNNIATTGGKYLYSETCKTNMRSSTLNRFTSETVAATGDGHAHDNLPPFLAVEFIIRVVGDLPFVPD